MGSKTRYPGREEARKAVARAEKAVELLARVFELMSEDDPIQPIVEQLYAVLREAEDRPAILEDWYSRTYGQEAERRTASTTIEETGNREKGEAVDQSSANKANKAAEQLMAATWDTYKILVGHMMCLQQRNAKFVREMVDDSIEELRRQAESNQAMTRELLELAEGQREAFRELVEESVLDAYTNFLFTPFTPFSYYRERTRSVAPESVEHGSNGRLPIENYDELPVREVSRRLEGLSEQELQIIRSYEERHKNRETLLKQLDRKLV